MSRTFAAQRRNFLYYCPGKIHQESLISFRSSSPKNAIIIDFCVMSLLCLLALWDSQCGHRMNFHSLKSPRGIEYFFLSCLIKNHMWQGKWATGIHKLFWKDKGIFYLQVALKHQGEFGELKPAATLFQCLDYCMFTDWRGARGLPDGGILIFS